MSYEQAERDRRECYQSKFNLSTTAWQFIFNIIRPKR
jgi:hypothetical protein